MSPKIDARVSSLTFLGAAGTVTGSKTLLDTPNGRILIDCGLYQGKKDLRLRNWQEFPVPPSSIDAVLLTHAHIDHCGYLPRLAKAGFSGPVYCTPGTQQLAHIVLPDSGHLHEQEAAFANRVGSSRHSPALPLYTELDAHACLDLFEPVIFGERRHIIDGVAATWRRAGHILGAAAIDVHLLDSDKHVVLSGDQGRREHPLLVPPDRLPEADVLVLESTYGDQPCAAGEPASVIADTIHRIVSNGGVAIVPAFAVDRTEMVLWHLDRLVSEGLIPNVPVYVDSPMALRALDVYRDETRRGAPDIRAELHGTELFSSLELFEARSVDESKEINERQGPMIIVSASGMATGGRVLHHLAQRVGDPRNEIVLVGFQAPGTRGDALRHGAKQIKIFGRDHPVRARVTTVALSAHAHADELIDWVRDAPRPPGIVYANHGEPEAAAGLVEQLRLRGVDAEIARADEPVPIT